MMTSFVIQLFLKEQLPKTIFKSIILHHNGKGKNIQHWRYFCVGVTLRKIILKARIFSIYHKLLHYMHQILYLASNFFIPFSQEFSTASLYMSYKTLLAAKASKNRSLLSLPNCTRNRILDQAHQTKKVRAISALITTKMCSRLLFMKCVDS